MRRDLCVCKMNGISAKTGEFNSQTTKAKSKKKKAVFVCMLTWTGTTSKPLQVSFDSIAYVYYTQCHLGILLELQARYHIIRESFGNGLEA